MSLVDQTTGELVTLTSLEQVIESGLGTFFEVGTALATIRDHKLYKDTHRTFEAYCEQRWGFSASRARQLVKAAATVTDVTLAGAPAPKTEAAARALSAATEDTAEAAEVMTEVGPDATAPQITEAAKRRNGDSFDSDEMLEDERGKLATACRALSKMRHPSAMVAAQRDHLSRRHVEYAEQAYAWLDEFLLELRGEQ